MESDKFERLSEWGTVVVNEPRTGCRLLWGRNKNRWLRATGDSARFEEPDGEPDARPSHTDLQRVLELEERLTQVGCQRCGLRGLHNHCVAPNVYGVPTRYCVQLPDCSVVEAAQGTGQRKHWGHINACQATDGNLRFVVSRQRDEEIMFMNAMVATRVCLLPWCTKCVNAASRIPRIAELDGVTVEEVERREIDTLLARRATYRQEGRHPSHA
ncbi:MULTISPECIES: hypothetical protein [unclassified Rhodococcus (in: high G+C Gram-positive bacteria)]|uniref:hypothetical protein n=1 Tax=unclassified Rhodococcus (in: high G+C Gram-positive bacteria) TaxID=192944 RepID=UPI00163A7225|nr:MULTISPECIES: hypothetical protein [unclassified Rhodococcus (in: high G+C Gram-positive bacteria)]MBC2644772.1 hypothetical protein [Rhodococcus sp. 3A]MBC2898367.1 hypothetical protein [Rhodococcus sp. 4CII]